MGGLSGLLHSLCSFQNFRIPTVDIQAGAFSGSGICYQGKMIDTDVALDGIVMLPIPHTGSLFQIHVVAQGQCLQAGSLHLLGIVDDDLSADIFAASIPFGHNRADFFLTNIVLGDKPCLMRDDNGLATVRFQAFRVENVFRKPQFPSLGTVGLDILKDTCGRDDGSVHQVSFSRIVRLVQRNAVQARDMGEHGCSNAFWHFL